MCFFRVDLGVMIFVFYNVYYDNGIKLFGLDGYKFFDDVELEIESFMVNGFEEGFVMFDVIGWVK